MRIALVQQRASNDIDANIDRGVNSVNEAASEGVKIICFAELAFTPFYPQVPAGNGIKELAETIPGRITDIFTKLARQHKIVIVLNIFERENDKTYDSSPVIDADGKILGSTRMIHITDYPCFHEKGYYAPGNNGAPVYKTKYGNLGVAICYDRHYPEYMRALALGGAEIVFIPQAGSVGEWTEGLYEAEMRVAAFQNGYFTALCNRVGKEDKLTFSGDSFICDPAGNIIAQAGTGNDEILYCDIDLQKVKNSHAKKLFLRDRRPELYSAWLKK